jgi:hypothetical protein
VQLLRSLSLSARLAAVLLLLVGPASAQPPAPAPLEDTAHFLIETITVETDREASAHIVKAETLLKEGETYTEDDLRQAIARVHRLPFVLDATFSLRKGSERGTYELVVEAHTARWFFFDRGLQYTSFDRAYALEGNFLSSSHYAVSQTGLVGGRLFVGRSGVLYTSLGFHQDLVSDGLGIELGYTRYDLFGLGIVADASYSTNHCCTTEVLPFGISPNLQVWDWKRDEQATLSLAAPLSRNRSLQFVWTERWGDAGDHRALLFEDSPSFFFPELILGGDQRSRQMIARWIRDTSDDPILPSRGSVLSAGLEYAEYDARNLRLLRFPYPDPPVEGPSPDFHGEQRTAALSATRHWSLTPRQSVSATGRISYGRSQATNLDVNRLLFPQAEFDVFGVSVGAKHLLRLWSLREPGNHGDLYLETEVRYGVESSSPDFGLRDNPLGRLEISTGLTFRNRWGRLRLALAYLNLTGVL